MNEKIKEYAYNRMLEADLFSRKFGTFAKSDYEVLMFTIYLDSVEDPVSDYDLSIALGITETKVRNLRLRSQLLYPKELNWRDELASGIEHGFYDPVSKQITVTFENPSVLNLVKSIVEKNFGTVGRSFNSKQLILPIESFLLLAAYAEKEPQLILDRLNKEYLKQTKNEKSIETKNIKGRFFDALPDVLDFLNNAVSLYIAGRPIVEQIINKLK